MDILRIPKKPPNQRVWVVRASGGLYLEHFRHAGIAAIGHMDAFRRPSPREGVLEIDADRLALWLLAKEDMTKPRASSHLSQIQKFISDIQPGDLVISVDAASVMPGIVTGPAFLSPYPIEIPRGKNDWAALEFQLRRPISWGPLIPRASLPYAVETSLFSHQTVFNIDSHARAIYHLIYPIFVWDETLNFSLRINSEKNVSNVRFAQLLLALSYAEAIAELEDAPASIYEALAKGVVDGALAEQLLLSVKAAFLSPGDVWGKLPASTKKMAGYIALLSVLFSGVEVGHIKVGGGIVIDIDHIKIPAAIDAHKIAALKKFAIEHGVDKFIASIGLTMSKRNTEPLDKPKPTPERKDEIPVMISSRYLRRSGRA